MYHVGCEGCLMEFGQESKFIPGPGGMMAVNLQLALFDAGYPDTGAPGWNPKVTANLKKYQAKFGLHATGKPDYMTVRKLLGDVAYPDWAKMYADVTGKVPDQQVWRIQMSLRKLQFNPGPVDGLMGKQTKVGIKAWQKTRAMKQTGVLSANDMQKLFSQAEGGAVTVGALMITAAGDELPPEPVVLPSLPPPGLPEALEEPESPAVTAAIMAAEAAGVPVVEKVDPGVRSPRVVYIREPATQEIIRVEKLIPGKVPVLSPWIWVAGGAVGVLAVGGIAALLLRGRGSSATPPVPPPTMPAAAGRGW